MIGMGGNLGAILSSRLSTRLHLGLLEFDPRDEVLWTNIFAILGLAVTIFSALGIAAWVVGQVIAEPMALVDLMLISVVSGMLLAVIAIALSLGATYVSYTQGWTPTIRRSRSSRTSAIFSASSSSRWSRSSS